MSSGSVIICRANGICLGGLYRDVGISELSADRDDCRLSHDTSRVIVPCDPTADDWLFHTSIAVISVSLSQENGHAHLGTLYPLWV